jgi:hypothetical protein
MDGMPQGTMDGGVALTALTRFDEQRPIGVVGTLLPGNFKKMKIDMWFI